MMMMNESMETITERLSSMENLYFPRAAEPSSMDSSQRKSLLHHLLSRDPAVFLERYGSQLTSEELVNFDALNEDYEINWHLKHLRSEMTPTTQELKLKSVMVKNRRRAYMNKLVYDGEYFSEDAMRSREPYLHHEYVGQYQDLGGRRMAWPGERWSETLMRRTEEAILVAKIRGEQQRLGIAERFWVGGEGTRQEEEEGEQEEEEEDDNTNGHSAEGQANQNAAVIDGPAPTTFKAILSEEEMQDQMDQFTHMMQEKFLAGEDNEHQDYSKIDSDETLDDHWSREANHDAEEKYFAEDG